MKKVFYLIAIILSMSSCKKESNKTTNVEKNQDNTTLKLHFSENTFMSVYDLSDKTTAIVINLNETEKPTKFDELFEKIDLKNSISNDFYNNSKESKNISFVDTLKEYKLISNIILTKEIRKNVDAKYFIYGTKGYSEMKINDVVLGLDECKTNIIGLTIKNFDAIKNGNPLLCSNKLFKLEYKKNYNAIETLIEKYNKSKNYEYTDKIKTRVFANLDSIYFTYNDDFVCGKNPQKSKCLYPTRAIFLLKKTEK